MKTVAINRDIMEREPPMARGGLSMGVRMRWVFLLRGAIPPFWRLTHYGLGSQSVLPTKQDNIVSHKTVFITLYKFSVSY